MIPSQLSASQTEPLNIFVDVYFHVKVVFCFPLSLLSKINYSSLLFRTRKFYRSYHAFLLAYFFGFILCEFANLLFLQWVQSQLILHSNDIEKNPGPVPRMGNCFNFCTWNLNSISAHDFSRVSLLEAFNNIHKFDVIAICETHLDSTIDLPVNAVDADRLALSNYQFIKNNHPDDVKRGGVGLYYKDTLPLKQRRDLEILQECLVCELCFDNKKIFFVVIYRSPSQNREEFDHFLDQFEHLITNINQENPYSVIVTGDFNCRSPLWWPDDISNVEGELLEPLTSSLDLHQLISEPTHFIGNSKSCIDLIFTDQPNLFVETEVHPSLDPVCHHSIISGKINIRCPPVPSFNRKIWDYDKANTNAIRESILKFPWEVHLSNLSPNEQASFFTETLLNVFSNFIPNQNIKVKPRDPPWLNRDIKNLLMRSKRAYKKFIRRGCREEEREQVTLLREDVSRSIENAKQTHLEKLGNDLANKDTGIKKYWSIINSFFNKNKFPVIPPLLVNDVFVTNCTKKAQLFNAHFVQQCSLIETGSTLPQFHSLTDQRLDSCNITEENILKLIRSLDPNKAHGWDGISVRMIRICDFSIVTPLKIIFQNCLENGVFPKIWKKGNIVPIHKKSSKQLIKNYRPISLLPVFGKMFEKVIYSSIYEYLEKNGLLSAKQSGFRPGDSTINQLLAITHEIFTAFDCNPPLDVRSVYLDISKAFDRVWHDGLIFKIQRCGISGKLLQLLASFLSERQQRTVINGKCSSWEDVSAGVPQGSILGPLLFLVYINDLPDGLKSNARIFADDTSLFSVVLDPLSSSDVLNFDLNLIKSWAHQWKMSFNPDPSKQAVQLIFSRKRAPLNHPQIHFNDIQVSSVNEHKHLGLILDKKLTFSSHIKDLLGKANKGIGMIKLLSRYLPRPSLDQIYKLHVRSHFDYCDIIYHVPPVDNPYSHERTQSLLMNRLESMQYNAALAVTGAWRGTSREKLYKELGWESLSNRRWYRRLVLFFKIVKGLAPAYLSSLLPEMREQSYALRNTNSIAVPKRRTDAFKNSFFPHCINEWNNLSLEFRELRSLSLFKTRLISLVRPVKNQIFGIHDPSGVRRLTQLRVGLSPLREHRFRHNFLDTTDPMCLTNDGIETTTHFMLLCQEYAIHRTVLLDRVTSICASHGVNCNMLNDVELLTLLLYGNDRFSESSNKNILLATITYINTTNRFN